MMICVGRSDSIAVARFRTDPHRSDRIFEAYYLRTSDQREIDLVIETDQELWTLEIKLTTRPSTDDMSRLDANAHLIKADRRFRVTRRREFIDDGSRVLCDLEGLLAFIEQSG